MSTVIKAIGPVRTRDGMSFNFDDMSHRASAHLDTYRVQANEIIAQAKKDADTIRRKAEEDGKQAAIRAVDKVMEEKVGKQLATLLPAIKQIGEQLAQAKQSWLGHWEKAAVNLSARIAEKVIRKELARDPQITLRLVKESLELATGSAQITVRMHPDDLATLGTHVEALTREIGRQGTASVVADATLSPGGCRVDTKFGTIDQTIESQLARIEQELT